MFPTIRWWYFPGFFHINGLFIGLWSSRSFFFSYFIRLFSAYWPRWILISFQVHVKIFLSYRIVSYRSLLVAVSDLWPRTAWLLFTQTSQADLRVTKSSVAGTPEGRLGDTASPSNKRRPVVSLWRHPLPWQHISSSSSSPRSVTYNVQRRLTTY